MSMIVTTSVSEVLVDAVVSWAGRSSWIKRPAATAAATAMVSSSRADSMSMSMSMPGVPGWFVCIQLDPSLPCGRITVGAPTLPASETRGVAAWVSPVRVRESGRRG